MGPVVGLEKLISDYRRTEDTKECKYELEVRFGSVDFEMFRNIYGQMLRGGGGVVERSVRGIGRGARHTAVIMEKTLDPSRGAQQAEAVYFTKERIAIALCAPGDYKITLSAERAIKKTILTGTTLFRVKNRVSFKRDQWRYDFTVVKETSTNEGELKSAVAELFPQGQTPENFIEILNLKANDRRYRYEIEAEHIGGRSDISPAQVREVADALLSHVSANYMNTQQYRQELNLVAEYIDGKRNPDSLKRLLPQVTALSGGEYNRIYPPKNYWLTDKADGARALAVARGGRLVVLSSAFQEVLSGARSQLTIVDGELVIEEGITIFYGFDVIACAGVKLTQKGFEVRIKHLAEAVEIVAKFMPARAKPYERLGGDKIQLRAAFEKIYRRERLYKIDGLILVEPDRKYSRTTTYKWKKMEDTTIDFLARKAPSEYYSSVWPKHRLYLLFVGITAELFECTNMVRCNGYGQLFPANEYADGYFPIQFQPADMPHAYLYHHPADSNDEIDGKIVELAFAGGVEDKTYRLLPKWRMVRVRADREGDLKARSYYGNDFRVAELTWVNYIDPFPYDDLIEGHNDSYFSTERDSIYRAHTAYTSYIKSELIKRLDRAGWVVDLGIGKGQDLGRYMAAHVRSLVGVDLDRAALAELVRRKYSHLKNLKGEKVATTLHVLRLDIAATPASEVVDVIRSFGLPKEGGNAVVCNLAVHYFVGTHKLQDNFALLCRGLVELGGCVFLTYMDGEKVFERLAGLRPGERWEMRESEIVKFAITRNYTADALTPAGQKISVLLPFSNNQMYEEALVNTSALIRVFEGRGFAVKEHFSFLKKMAEFKNEKRGNAVQLSPADLSWLELYVALVFVRTI